MCTILNAIRYLVFAVITTFPKIVNILHFSNNEIEYRSVKSVGFAIEEDVAKINLFYPEHRCKIEK